MEAGGELVFILFVRLFCLESVFEFVLLRLVAERDRVTITLVCFLNFGGLTWELFLGGESQSITITEESVDVLDDIDIARFIVE
jgi:hypothetical protein